MRKLLLLMFLNTAALVTMAQETFPDILWDENATLHDIERVAGEFFAEHGTKNGGWKQYNRWLYDNRPYFDENGNRIQFGSTNKELAKFRKSAKAQKVAVENPVWSELGPRSSETGPFNTSNGNGNGRIQGIDYDAQSGTFFITSRGGGLWRSSDEGQNWEPLGDEFASMVLNDVAVAQSNPSVIYAGGTDFGDFYKSTDGGNTWQTISYHSVNFRMQLNRILVHPQDENNVLLFTSQGIFRSLNGGTSFTRPRVGGTFEDATFKPGDPSVVYAVDRDMYRSTDGGATFTQITTGAVNDGKVAVTAANPEVVYHFQSSSDYGLRAIYRSMDGGDTFEQRLAASPSNGTNYLGRGSFSSGGQSWVHHAVMVSETNIDDVMIGGIFLFRSTDGAASFTMDRTVNGNRTLHDDNVDIEIINGKVYLATDGGLYKKETFTSNWDDITGNLGIRQYYRMGGVESMPYFITAGSQDNGTWALEENNVTSWYKINGGDGMETFIDYEDPSIVYTTTQWGYIQKKTNFGKNFAPINRPVSGDFAWVSPFEMDPVDHNTIYVGLDQMYKSTDAGINWTPLTTFSGQELQHFDVAQNPNYIYLSTRNASYYSHDAGATWTEMTTIRGYAFFNVNAVDPLKVVAAYSNTVYVSEDGGVTWTNIDNNLPNVAVRCVLWANDSDNTLYVGTEVGLFTTDDNTSNWVKMDNGLPNTPIYEMEINYATSKLRAATYGRGMWEATINLQGIGDEDNDGYSAVVDCDDNNPDINPGATDIPGNGIDEDCDGQDASIIGGTPFNGTPQAIPGLVEAEFYDEGGAGVAYFDTDAGNNGNAIRNDDVDVEFGSSNGNVGWIFDGEWLNYTVVVASDGLYTVNASVASINSGTSFNLMLDGQELTGSIDVPNTGNWQTYQTVSVSDLNLTAGTHVLRFNATANGFNVDEFVFVLDRELIDNDNDGFFVEDDCDDNNPNINPDADEIINNDVDENCNGAAVQFDYTVNSNELCIGEELIIDVTSATTVSDIDAINFTLFGDGITTELLAYDGSPISRTYNVATSVSVLVDIRVDGNVIQVPQQIVNITTCDDNQPPVVAAGDFKQITLPTNSVTINDAVAFDNDGTIASLQWSQDAGPNTATISNGTTIEPTFSGLVEGLYDFRLTGTDDDGASSFGLVSVRVNPAENQPPVVAAGDFKQITLPTNSVTVNDAVAFDNDGTIASLQWTQDSGPNTATISNGTTIEPTFSGLVEGLYEFRLTGTDDDGASSFGTVSVRVNPAENQPPVVGAGDFKQITLPTNSVIINDATAFDNDGTIASLQWTQDSGPNTATITDGTTIEPTFSGLVEGLYEFRLTATDDDGATNFGTVSVRVNPAENQPPVVGAGDFKQITLPTDFLAIDDAVAFDNDGTIVSLQWTQDSGPSTATIGNATTIEPTISGLVAGLYEFRLTATDDDGATNFGTVSVRVNPAENQPPVVGAGDFKQITLPTDFLAIDDAVAFDNDGTIVSLQWTQDSGPNTATIGNATTIEPTISGLVAGLYEFRLTATDDDGATNFGTVSVRVHPAASNQTPFNGTAQVIPGTVEAEFYDEGGANEAYFDTDAGNNGNFLRSDDVDVEVGSSNGNVGWIFDGEWLEYTVDVQTTGSYSVAVSVASINSGTSFNLELDGNSLTGTINVPNTGNWQSYQTVTAEGLQMTAGTHILRFNALANGFNVDDYVFTLEAGPVDNDNDGFTADVDCDDNNPAINPGATEVCDGVDNDCDGQIDEGVLTLFYFDRDQDQFGSQTEDPIAACVSPEPAFLYETNNDDCDDTRDVDFPGAPENCDQRDNDCDGQVDEGIATSQFFADDDNDGFGDPSRPVQSCGFFVGISSNDEDCNDENSAVNPNAAEICDGIDNDCDGEIDEDGDLITWYRDQDNDTYGNPDITIESCTQPDGYVDRAGDCDDTRDNMNPDEQELCDQIDNNCNGVNNEGLLIMQYQDVDGDGFGTPDSSLSACAVISGFVLNDEDCDDNNGAVNPDATEICDEIDNDCDGEIDEGVQTQFFADSDRDGWGANNTWVWACSNPGNVPEAFVLISGDCNDSHSGINPGVDEIPGNGFDDNCDGEIDEEAGCEVEAANGEYTLSISENGNQLVVDWDGLAGMGNGFVFMDQWVDGNYRGSFAASVDFGQRIFGLDNIAQGSTVEFFFKYDRPGGQYIGARTDHSYTMGECAGVAKKAVTTEAVSFSLLPNPAFDEITIEAQGADILKATIIGNRGVVNSPVIGSGNTMKVDVSDLATGIYTVQIETISGIEFVRFVKQ